MSSQEMPPPGAAPSEEELRAAYEAELARINVTDLIAQTAVSLLNLAARRLAPAPAGGAAQGPGGAPAGDGRDLEQARDAIDAVRSLLEILERRMPDEVRPLRDALSQLQMAYAREADVLQGSGETGGGEEGGREGSGREPGEGRGGSGGASAGGAPPSGGSGSQDPGPGPAESSGRLWVPGR